MTMTTAAIFDIETPCIAQELSSLTTEQTNKLKKVSKTQAIDSRNDMGDLQLNGIKSLTPEIAAALVPRSYGDLYLNGLTKIDPEVAAALAVQEVGLHLDGLTELSPEAAKELGQSKNRGRKLTLNGLKTISPEVAIALVPPVSRHKRYALELDGLKNLTPEAARILTRHTGVLSLGGLTSLPADVAVALAEPEVDNFERSGFIELNGLKTLSPRSARGLASRGSRLDLNGITKLSEGAARGLATSRGYGIHLGALADLDVKTAKALAKFDAGPMSLGLKKLSPEVAAALSTRRHAIYFKTLTEVSPDAAKALTLHTGTLEFHALVKMSAETKKALLRHKGDVIVPDGDVYKKLEAKDN